MTGLGRAAGLSGRLVRGLGDLIVPPVCHACQERVGSPEALCARCWRQVAFIRPPLCDRLGIPLPFGGPGPLISAAAAADPPNWGRARAVALYETGGVMARLITGMKYHDRHDAQRLFGRWLAEAGRDLLADADLIVPVPMTRWRLFRRQFNQAALLAREISHLTGVAWEPDGLRKVRSTKPQVALTGQARRENLRRAFAVNPRRVDRFAGRRIVLLDDVLTTGTTLDACTRTLLAAGAASVDVLVLARVPPPTHASP